MYTILKIEYMNIWGEYMRAVGGESVSDHVRKNMNRINKKISHFDLINDKLLCYIEHALKVDQTTAVAGLSPEQAHDQGLLVFRTLINLLLLTDSDPESLRQAELQQAIVAWAKGLHFTEQGALRFCKSLPSYEPMVLDLFKNLVAAGVLRPEQVQPHLDERAMRDGKTTGSTMAHLKHLESKQEEVRLSPCT